MSFEYDQELDCCGLLVPMPTLKTKKALDTLQAGQVLKMISNDGGTLSDIQAWASNTGNTLLGYETEGEKLIFYIKRKEDQAGQSLSFEFDQELDCSGLPCPMPILKTKKFLETLKAGQVLKMTATDVAALADIQAWTSNTGHILLGYKTEGEKFIFYIKRKEDPADHIW